MDRLTKEDRHRCMSAIKGKDTSIEKKVRKFLFARGYRYRLNYNRLPGHPDIVMKKYRTVIFVNGCFWHGHEGCRYFRLPKTNVDYWSDKIKRNKERDKEEIGILKEMGWHCITVWECQLKPMNFEKTMDAVIGKLDHIMLENHKLTIYKTEEDAEETSIAAEPNEVKYEKR